MCVVLNDEQSISSTYPRPALAGAPDGERRWLAAQRAGLETVPAIVREIDDRTAIAMALVENILEVI